MIHADISLELVEMTRAKIPVVSGSSNLLGGPLTMDFSMANGPPASHNENYVHSWLQETVEAHQLLLGKIVCYVGLRRDTCCLSLDDYVCGTPLWVLAPHLPPNTWRPYLAPANRAVRNAIYRILGVSQNAQTLDQLNCAKRQLSLPAEFRGLNVPSLELDAEPPHYASFPATLANLINDYKSESLGLMYGLILHELVNVATT
jgi:hypothetical protein